MTKLQIEQAKFLARTLRDIARAERATYKAQDIHEAARFLEDLCGSEPVKAPEPQKPFGGLHVLDSSFESCACGSDAVTCQICGQRVCGREAEWVNPVPGKAFAGNVCARHLPIATIYFPKSWTGAQKAQYAMAFSDFQWLTRENAIRVWLR